MRSNSEFTVTFNPNNGDAVITEKVKYEEKVTKPADPTRYGYKFQYWTLDDKKYDFETSVTGPITLVAKWEKLPDKGNRYGNFKKFCVWAL